MLRRLISANQVAGLMAAFLFGGTVALEAQSSSLLIGDDTPRPWGQGVAPVYEGWYENPEGEGYYISFGYLNRNSEELLDIPVGPDNALGIEDQDGIQPTHFLPWRQYGVFTVWVPEDFGRSDAVWSLTRNGETFEIPGRISNINYQIDAMYAPGSGLTPPALRFDRDGEEARGPHGIRTHAGTVAVGEPLELTVWTEDDTWITGEGSTEAHDVTLYWYKYQGPGDVQFNQARVTVPPASDLARGVNSATFSEPGEYVLYVRAHNESPRSAGMEQCCWTNGYVGVTVTP